jgi:hypothetical protein
LHRVNGCPVDVVVDDDGRVLQVDADAIRVRGDEDVVGVRVLALGPVPNRGEGLEALLRLTVRLVLVDAAVSLPDRAVRAHRRQERAQRLLQVHDDREALAEDDGLTPGRLYLLQQTIEDGELGVPGIIHPLQCNALLEKGLKGGLVAVSGNLGGGIDLMYNAVGIAELAIEKGATTINRARCEDSSTAAYLW